MGYIQISVQEKKEAMSQDSKSLVLNCFGYKPAILLKGLVLFSRILTFKNFMTPFYGWGSTASRLEPLRGGSLLFTTEFPENILNIILHFGELVILNYLY